MQQSNTGVVGSSTNGVGSGSSVGLFVRVLGPPIIKKIWDGKGAACTRSHISVYRERKKRRMPALFSKTKNV